MIPGLSGIEFLAIFIVAILIIPPKDFPKVAAQAGRMWVKLKHQLSNIRVQIDRAIADAELEEIKKASDTFSEHMGSLKDVEATAKKYVSRAIASEGLDVASEVKEVIEDTQEAIENTAAEVSEIKEPSNGG